MADNRIPRVGELAQVDRSHRPHGRRKGIVVYQEAGYSVLRFEGPVPGSGIVRNSFLTRVRALNVGVAL